MTITREQQKQILIDTANHVISRDNTSPYSENLRELARIALASLDAEPVRYLNKFSGTCVTLEQQPNAAADVAVYIPLYTTPPVPERERIRREHAEWSDKTFGDVGPVGPLKHLSKEALEAAAAPSDPLEWADMQFLLWDAQRRAGITDEQIALAMVEKLAVNKRREWPEPKDGEPRLHIKEQSAPVTQDGWISCSERMPDNDESKPIAIFTGKCLGQGMFVATYDDDGFFDYWEGMEIIGVSHWMPLPAPPKK
ncbi:DUF550 domain-containing protein [Salmonella enterica subsp. enterica serovar Napoli]|nr:DUF550 domain-containing protein [Salmonella enterica subsp. enterica serovar Napoli]ECB3570556.1 DUF550 domain-containing protein [Salmonella enterica subsp. enterica serovar Napoli]